MRQYVRARLRYASDLTDCEWALLEPLMPPPSPIGRPRETDLRVDPRPCARGDFITSVQTSKLT
jgi:transposase